MPESIGYDEPYIVRGHHMTVLANLVAPYSETPVRLAKELRADSIYSRGDLTSETVDWSALSADKVHTDEHWATYAYDLLGSTDVEADTFEAKYADALTDFVILADDAPVILTGNGMDNICGACTFKQHCIRPEESSIDAKYLEVFEDVLGFAQKVDPSLDVSVIKTGSGEIITSAKAVRRVLAHFAIAKTWQGALFDDALKRREEFGNVFAGPDASTLEKYYESYGHEIVSEQ